MVSKQRYKYVVKDNYFLNTIQLFQRNVFHNNDDSRKSIYCEITGRLRENDKFYVSATFDIKVLFFYSISAYCNVFYRIERQEQDH